MGVSHDDACKTIKATARSLKSRVPRIGAYVCTIQGSTAEFVRDTDDSLNTLGFLKTLSLIVESFDTVIKSESRRLCCEMLAMKKRIENLRENLKYVLKKDSFKTMNEEIEETFKSLLSITDLLFHLVLESDSSIDVVLNLLASRDTEYQYTGKTYKPPQDLMEKFDKVEQAKRKKELARKKRESEAELKAASAQQINTDTETSQTDTSLVSTSSEAHGASGQDEAMETGSLNSDDENLSKSSDAHAHTVLVDADSSQLGSARTCTSSDTPATKSLPTGTLQSHKTWKSAAVGEGKILLKGLVDIYVQIGCEISNSDGVPLNGLLALFNRWQPLQEVKFFKTILEALDSPRSAGYAERTLMKLKRRMKSLEDFQTVLVGSKYSTCKSELRKASDELCKLSLKFSILSYLDSMEEPQTDSVPIASEES